VLTTSLTLATIMTFTSCRDQQRGPHRDIAALENIVRLPMRPLEVWFASVPRGKGGEGIGPSDRTLIAIMRFAPAEIARFLAKERPAEKPEPRLPRSEVLDWFPPPVIAAMEPLGAEHFRIKGRRFDAAPFAKGSFAGGSFFVLDSVPFIILRRPEN
jgi:hypothetical protein